jgi:hypothetical protein
MTIYVAAAVLPLVPRVSPPPLDTLIRDEDAPSAAGMADDVPTRSRRSCEGAEELALFRTIHIQLRPQSRARGGRQVSSRC